MALRLSLQPFLQTIESKKYNENGLGIQDANALHSLWFWLHPGHLPTYLALYKDGNGLRIQNGTRPGSWGPINLNWQI
eukprot:7316804-Karenia_brevis.AAC.1